MNPIHRTSAESVFFLALCLVLSAGYSQASQPEPPARIVPPSPSDLETLEPENSFFTIPLRVIAEDRVGDIALEVRVIETDSLHPNIIVSAPLPVDMEHGVSDETIDLEVPGPGRFKVEVNLVGDVGRGPAVLDRYVFYQIVDDTGARLMTPPNLRRLERENRRNEFLEHLNENPGQPEVRLLAPRVAEVPAGMAQGIELYDDVPQLGAPADGPPDEFVPYTRRQAAATAPRSRDPITVKGRLIFIDFDGTVRPLINATVNIYDNDLGPDEHLGTVASSADGTWTMTVEGADGIFQNGRDLYYEFHLGNARWSVRDAAGDNHSWVSHVAKDLEDGSAIDFGDATVYPDPEPAQIFAMLNLGWIHITTMGGQDPGFVQARYPDVKSVFSPSTGQVRLAAGLNDSPDVVLHEYGHALMHNAFGGININPGGTHFCEDTTQDKGLAYSEGWATAFALSVCPDGVYNLYEGNEEQPGEWPECQIQNDLYGPLVEHVSIRLNRVGEENECRIAAAITDFLDEPDDDNAGTEDRGRHGHMDSNTNNRIPLATIYRDVMWGYVHRDFLQFWLALEGELYGDSAELAREIMQYNWMSLPEEEPPERDDPFGCAATHVVAVESENEVDLLAGLRQFRDHALKPTRIGRQLIQAYYRHGPELATLLVRNGGARDASLVILEYVSALGRALSTHDEQIRLFESEEPAISTKIASAIEVVSDAIMADGSPELIRELAVVSEIVEALEGRSLRDAFREASGLTRAEKGPVMNVVEPYPLGPASRAVDWAEIRRHLERHP